MEERNERPTTRIVTVHNPATSEAIARYPELDADALRSVIRRARGVQPEWASLSLNARQHHVARMREWLAANADEAAATIRRCTGKTTLEALSFDVTPAVFSNAWYCSHARKYLSSERIPVGNILLANKRSRLYRHPQGVIGIIAPWNYPLGIPMHEIVPALLAGNTVVFKTAPETIPVGELIDTMCKAAALPADVFHHVVVDGPICGDVMLEENGVDKLFFTGSVRVGKILAEKAARALKDVSLELGGKDAMIVLDDANIERAAHGAIWGGMQNAGQACAGVERVYVQRAVHDAFLAETGSLVKRLRAKGPDSDESDIGVMTTERQVETVKAHIEEALRAGANIHAKSRIMHEHARLVPPTVLTNVHHGMRIMREETFGPVIGVMPFDSDDEAVTLANDSRYGLTASIWSRNAARADRIARHLDVGAITINDHVMSHGVTETPWGGTKESGLGRGHGRFAFEAVTKLKVIIDDRLAFAPRNLWWYPYSKNVYDAMRGAIVAFHGRGFAKRFSGLRHFLTALPGMFRKF